MKKLIAGILLLAIGFGIGIQFRIYNLKIDLVDEKEHVAYITVCDSCHMYEYV